VADPRTWRMFAHDDDGRLTNLGPRRYVELHGLPYPIVEVELTEVTDDDPTATHWGWMRTDADTPSMIWPSKPQFEVCFPYGYRAEEKAGKGRAMRFAVRAIADREATDG
jgi:hypothetical protein